MLTQCIPLTENVNRFCANDDKTHLISCTCTRGNKQHTPSLCVRFMRIMLLSAGHMNLYNLIFIVPCVTMSKGLECINKNCTNLSKVPLWPIHMYLSRIKMSLYMLPTSITQWNIFVDVILCCFKDQHLQGRPVWYSTLPIKWDRSVFESTIMNTQIFKNMLAHTQQILMVN